MDPFLHVAAPPVVENLLSMGGPSEVIEVLNRGFLKNLFGGFGIKLRGVR